MKTNKVSEKKIVKKVREGFKENIVPKKKHTFRHEGTKQT
jgi:hypothetical protein